MSLLESQQKLNFLIPPVSGGPTEKNGIKVYCHLKKVRYAFLKIKDQYVTQFFSSKGWYIQWLKLRCLLVRGPQ